MSGNVPRGEQLDFYNLALVRNLISGDTVIVLIGNNFSTNIISPKVRFMSASSVSGDIFNRSTKEGTLDSARTFDKVLYDTEYINGDISGYPAIIGNLGEFEFSKIHD